jgi:hypothetical protein
MRKYALGLASAAILASACSMSSGYGRGPNGRPVYYIDGMTAGAAYKKADKRCPGGYNIVNGAYQKTPLDYVMTIECK